MKKMFLALMVVLAVYGLVGCSSTLSAIENSKLQTDVKTSESFFLNPNVLVTAMKPGSGVYVRVTNTSEAQNNFDVSKAIKDKLTAMGYIVLPTPEFANYQINGNIRYLGENKPGMTLANYLGSSSVGASLGALIAASSHQSLPTTVGWGMGGALIGAAGEYTVGKAFTVKEYVGVVDIVIIEASEASQEKTMKNCIAVSAKQTNLDLEEACPVLADIIGTQVSGFFKM